MSRMLLVAVSVVSISSFMQLGGKCHCEPKMMVQAKSVADEMRRDELEEELFVQLDKISTRTPQPANRSVKKWCMEHMPFWMQVLSVRCIMAYIHCKRFANNSWSRFCGLLTHAKAFKWRSLRSA